MSNILKKYNIEFTYNDDSPGVLSGAPALIQCISRYNTTKKISVLCHKIKEFLDHGKQEEIYIPEYGPADFLLTKAETSILNTDVSEDDVSGIFILPTIDLLEICQAWWQFLAKHKHQKVEVSSGESIIDIISDGFINALVIERALAANWPDCMGSVGEYYSVSTHSYEKQIELTANLNEVLASGCDAEVFEAVKVFLNLFANGNYNILISEIDIASSEIARDGLMTYGVGVDEEEQFTYSTYPTTDLYLFSRSINTINNNRVAEYVDLISRGARPKLIAYSAYSYDEYEETRYYILDGHHKLLAYEQLRINAPTVYIQKEKREEATDKNILPQLLDVLKPNEFRHVLMENDNVADMSVYMQPEITHHIDTIFRERRNIDITLTQVLYKTYNSENAAERDWAEVRLNILSKNKKQGKKQILYYKTYSEKYNSTEWRPIFIENSNDFNLWQKIFLNDGEIPADLSERQKEISERYHPPHRPLPHSQSYSNSETYYRKPTYHEGSGTISWRMVLLIVVIAVKFLFLLKACS
jgi:hypothetical protein